nr:uncharacterized protein LOC132597811 [Globicephala melas]
MQLRIWYWHGGFYATEQLTSLKASEGNTSREPRERSDSLRSILSAGAPGRRQRGALRPPAPADSPARLGRSDRGLAEAVWPACWEAGHWRPQPGRSARPGGPRSGGEGGAAGQGGRGAEEVRSSRLGAGPQCRPGSGATTRGPGARGGRGSLRSKSCSDAGNRGGGDTTRSSCSSSSTWSPFMKNLLLDLSRRMRLSQKTVYQMSQAVNMPGNFWPTHQPKDFGCHWGKKSKSCSVDAVNDMVTEQATKNALFLSKATKS